MLTHLFLHTAGPGVLLRRQRKRRPQGWHPQDCLPAHQAVRGSMMTTTCLVFPRRIESSGYLAAAPARVATARAHRVRTSGRFAEQRDHRDATAGAKFARALVLGWVGLGWIVYVRCRSLTPEVSTPERSMLARLSRTSDSELARRALVPVVRPGTGASARAQSHTSHCALAPGYGAHKLASRCDHTCRTCRWLRAVNVGCKRLPRN